MKKGFTLIELLAVIVILAIIALIATPIVLNIIEETKTSASLRSAEMYLDAVDYAISSRMLKNKNIVDGTYNILENGNICLENYNKETKECKDSNSDNQIDILKVEVKGKIPESGSKVVIEGSEVKKQSSTNTVNKTEIILNNKPIIKNEEGEIVYPDSPICKKVTGDDLNYKYVYYMYSDDGDYSNDENLLGEATYTTGTKSVGDAYKCDVNDTDSYIFNIIGQDAQGNYNLLLNHNLGIATEISIDSVIAKLSNLTSSWINLDVRTDSYSGNTGSTDDTNDAYTFNYSGLYSRFMEYEELQKFASDGTWDDTSKPWISSIPNDKQTTTYEDWKYITSSIWGFDGTDAFYDGLACGVGACTIDTGHYGIRPIITVANSDIES